MDTQQNEQIHVAIEDISFDTLNALLGEEVQAEVEAAPEGIVEVRGEIIADDVILEQVETVSDDAADASDALLEEVISEIQSQEVRKEAYADQVSGDMNPDASVEVSAKTVEKKEKKERTPRSTFSSTSEAIKYKLGEKASEYFAYEMDDAALSEADLEKLMDQRCAEIDALPKKVQEKVGNIFNFLKGGERLSNYTMIGVKMLLEKGSVNSKELYEKMAESYSEGTARSQAQQMFSLLPALKVANRDRNEMRLNPNSIIADTLKSMLV